jgi:hypothetical protein
MGGILLLEDHSNSGMVRLGFGCPLAYSCIPDRLKIMGRRRLRISTYMTSRRIGINIERTPLMGGAIAFTLRILQTGRVARRRTLVRWIGSRWVVWFWYGKGCDLYRTSTRRRVTGGQCRLFLDIIDSLLNLGRYRRWRRRTLSIEIGRIVANENCRSSRRSHLSKLPTIMCSRDCTVFGQSPLGISYQHRLIRHYRRGSRWHLHADLTRMLHQYRDI